MRHSSHCRLNINVINHHPVALSNCLHRSPTDAERRPHILGCYVNSFCPGSCGRNFVLSLSRRTLHTSVIGTMHIAMIASSRKQSASPFCDLINSVSTVMLFYFLAKSAMARNWRIVCRTKVVCDVISEEMVKGIEIDITFNFDGPSSNRLRVIPTMTTLDTVPAHCHERTSRQPTPFIGSGVITTIRHRDHQ